MAILAAADPANPYGATLKWPAFAADAASAGRGPTRTVGATVFSSTARSPAYLARGDRMLLTFLPEAEPERSKAAREVARALIARAREGGESPRGMLLEDIDGAPATLHQHREVPDRRRLRRRLARVPRDVSTEEMSLKATAGRPV